MTVDLRHAYPPLLPSVRPRVKCLIQMPRMIIKGRGGAPKRGRQNVSPKPALLPHFHTRHLVFNHWRNHFWQKRASINGRDSRSHRLVLLCRPSTKTTPFALKSEGRSIIVESQHLIFSRTRSPEKYLVVCPDGALLYTPCKNNTT